VAPVSHAQSEKFDSALHFCLFSTVLDDDGLRKKTQYNVLLSCIRGFLTSCSVYIIFPVYNLSYFPAVVLIIPFWCPNVSRKYHIPADSVLQCF
jgi:hypothetical protein